MNTTKSQVTTKELSLLSDLLGAQALAATKAKSYSNCVSDPQAQQMLCDLAQHHTQCFDTLNQYLQSRS